MRTFFRDHPPAAIGIEACAGAHYWARTLNAMGHDVRLIAAQHVSRRVVGHKNDYRDAQVIAEYGAVFAAGVGPLRQGLVEVLGGEHLNLGDLRRPLRAVAAAR